MSNQNQKQIYRIEAILCAQYQNSITKVILFAKLFRLFEVTETVSGIYLMMEYAPGGELFVRLAECGSYTEHEAKPIFAQIASAVQYMVISLDIDYL